MLRTSARVAILALIVLCALTIHAQEPAKGKSAKVNELLEKRLAVARQIEMIALKRFESGQGTADELFAAQRLVHEAAMDASGSEKARIELLEDYLGKVKNLEAMQRRRVEAGQALATSELTATAERLRVEIAIERAKAGKGPADPRKPATDAKGKTAAYPATVKAFESVRVFARVSGTIAKQDLDIGDRVKSGQILAVVDVPGMDAVKRQHVAALAEAKARLRQAAAKYSGVTSDAQAARAAIEEADAKVRSAAATVQLHAASFQRMKALFASKAVDQALLDESKQRHETAVEAERVAKAMVATAKAQVAVSSARIDQAKAEIEAREAGVVIAEANLEKVQIELSLATIKAPFDGVITQRGYVVGDFVRSADKRNNDPPLVTIQRTDVLRTVIAVPQSDIPLISVGDPASVEVDAFPGKTWASKVTRLAGAVDAKTGTMVVEIDLPNAGQIIPGMTGRVTLERRKE